MKPHSLRVGLIYLILAGWWFFASDNLLSVILAGPAHLSGIQRYKLGLFVVITALLLYVLAGEARGRRPADPAPGRVATLLVPLLALMLLALGIAGSWYSAYREHLAQQQQEGQRALSATAALQAARLGDWVERRTAESRAAAEDPLLGAEAARWLAQGAPGGEIRDRLAARLESLRRACACETVFLLDAGGGMLLATDSDAALSRQDREFARQALEQRRLLFAGVHRRGDSGRGIELDIVTPLLAGTGEPPPLLYFRVDPRQAILPLLEAGAGAGQESLLLKRDGSAIVYLTWLRYRPDAALPLRVEPGTELAEGQLVLAQREGLARGTDYRGRQVVAAARRVPGTDWHLIAKADAAGLAAPAGRGGWVLLAVLAVLLALATGTMALWWYQQRARDHALRLSDELERESWRAQALKREARLAALFDQAADAVFVHDRTGRIVEANAQAARSLGYSREELCVMNIADLDPECGSGPGGGPWSTLAPGATATVGGLHRRKDGSTYPVEARLALIATPDGEFVLATVRDVSAQRAAEQGLRLYARVFEASGEAIMVTDAANRIVSVNPAFSEITGYPASEVLGRDPRLLASGRHDAEFYRHMWEAIAAAGHWRGELWNRRKSGEVYPELAHISAVRDGRGAITHHIAVFSDISERKAAEIRISFLAQHDMLTRLPNRALMHDRLSQAIAGAQRNSEQVALLFADLDRFKNVNDLLGHRVGDLLLQAVAERLNHCVRRGDTVSRVGGDEFVIVLPGVREEEAAARVARKALQSLSRPFVVEGHEIAITPSIGISIYPDDGADIEALVHNADAAMYEAKQRGRSQFQFYTADMNARALERIALEGALRRALEHDGFALHYQPQVEIASGRVVGIEALLRWQDPELARVATPHLIALAEDCGLMAALGERVLRQACARGLEWQAAGLRVPIAVNVSPLQLRQPGFRDRVAEILRATGLEPSRLELEVTEGALLQDAEGARAVAGELAALGLELVIDDFGAGYSSLQVLKGFHIRKLKIFQSLVRGIPGDAESAAMVGAILGLGASLGLRVLAEGVENEAQLAFLRAHGCHEAQGYLFGLPQPAEAFLDWLRERNARA